MDWKLELIVVPVKDVEQAKAFYTEKLGFREDVDYASGGSFRVVQMTPPGSACSISIGTNIGAGEPGSLRGLHLVVDDIEAAHEHLQRAGVANSGIQHFEDGGLTPGPDPDRGNYGSYVFFTDPDGNSWAVQEVHSR